MIRVAVVGPPGILRTGLVAMLRAQADVELAGPPGEEWEMAEASGPAVDVVVGLGDSLREALGGESPLPPVVLIWPVVEVGALREVLRAGAKAVLPQDCTGPELAAAVQAAAAGLIVMRPGDFLPLAADSRPAIDNSASLTPRELEVLRLLADGLANKEISYRLGISEHTVKFHVNSILTRLDASTRAEAVAIGLRRGLILL